jgi:predicted unusual protein kinase regulating ubiquinone biosynthesis (AarF/ABC1/UbiB family)
VSRSLPGTVLAGVAGRLAALALSLAIASGDTGAPGFTRNLWVFAAVFTMSASVWVELLAKPAAPAARRRRLALEECGGMFVKLGQVLSTRADLLPARVVAELGRPVAEVFAELDPEPIAAASIAQAYRGRLGSGQAVVVRVQRPGIAESVDRDPLVLAELARVAETRTAWGADDHVTDLAGELADRLREELDFRPEARNATEIAAAMFNDLLQLFFAFGIDLPPELSTFFCALVTLEGT